MKLTAKCGCGATLDLYPETGQYGREPSTYESARVTETFDKWNEAHRHCSEVMSRPQLAPMPLIPSWPDGTVLSSSNYNADPNVQSTPTISTE